MLTRQNDPAVDPAEIIVMLRSRPVGPVAGATQGKGHPMPRDSNAVLEFAPVLRVKTTTQFDGARDALGGRHRREFVSIGAAEQIRAKKDTFAASNARAEI